MSSLCKKPAQDLYYAGTKVTHIHCCWIADKTVPIKSHLMHCFTTASDHGLQQFYPPFYFPQVIDFKLKKVVIHEKERP